MVCPVYVQNETRTKNHGTLPPNRIYCMNLLSASERRTISAVMKASLLSPFLYKSWSLHIADNWLKKTFREFRKEIKERSALVANQTNIIDVVLKDLHALLMKEMDKGKTELVNNVARLVGLRVTTKGQGKNKAFLYDLEKGFRKSNPRGSSRGQRWLHLKNL